MKNFIQNGNTITLIAPYDVSSGGGLLVNALFGVASTDAKAGEEVEASIVGVYELPKADGQQVEQGGKLYWDDANKRLTTTANGNTKIGAATKATGPAEATVSIRLNGASA